MVRVRFWILMLASIGACALYLEQMYLSQVINRTQNAVMERQHLIALGSSYETSWKQLAMRMFQLGLQDPALLDVLKRQQIDVRSNSSAPSESQATQPTQPAQPIQSAPPAAPAPAVKKTPTK